MTGAVRLGLRVNARQFALLVGLNALVGAMVGLERSVFPTIGERDFGIRSAALVLLFVVAFGAAKATSNLAAGVLAERYGRKRVLLAGWAFAVPVAPLIALAPSWWYIVAANVLLGINQGLAWSMTVVMKIDLAGPERRGLALGLNESAGYVGLAIAAFVTGSLAAAVAPRTVVWVGAGALSAAGLLVSAAFVRDTAAHVAGEQGVVVARAARGVLRACNQAGLVNNLNDAVVWGLVPLFLVAHGAGIGTVAAIAAVYPAVWGLGQLVTGWLSDVYGRRPLIVAGMLVQAVALALLVALEGRLGLSLAAATFLGVGTALVYPTLLAAVSDAVSPLERARAVGAYRFWRDLGFVAGALVAGAAAAAASGAAGIVVAAVLTAASGLVVAATTWDSGVRPLPIH